MKLYLLLTMMILLFTGCQQHNHPNQHPAPAVEQGAHHITSEIWLKAGTFHAEIEGPTVDALGNFYAVNIVPKGSELLASSNTLVTSSTRATSNRPALGTIGKVEGDAITSILLTLPQGSIGNGMQFDGNGALWIADYKQHTIWRWHRNRLQAIWSDPRMHQPNDLVVTRKGVIFATDPSWRQGGGQLWRFSEQSQAELLGQMGTTNGIALSPDEQWLFVNESYQRRVWRFALTAEGNVGTGQLIHQFSDFGLDGMETSNDGDLWIARHGKGTIVRLSPHGELVAEYCLHGKFPSNLVFSPDQQWLYVTMQREGSVERLAVKDARTCT